MNLSKFDDIRPYLDSEVAPAMERIASNPLLEGIGAYLMPGKGTDFFKNILLSCKSINDFQERVMAFVINTILSKTAKDLTFGGISNFKADKKHLILTNHRDIVLDSAILQIILYKHNIQTTEIAVGDNLISSSFIEDLTRSNKMIKVVRNTTPREIYASSKKLSEYIRQSVATDSSSIWIAQRNGRTKDGLDLTEQGVLKMLDMSGNGDFVNDFDELSILPASISYEYEPCDLQKTVEIYVTKRQKYVKSKDEDLNSILTGIMQYKGNIHIEFTEPVTRQEIEEAAALDKNERFKYLTSAIDKRIVSTFKLWKNNYIAYDIVTGGDKYSAEYSVEEKQAFVEYMKGKLAGVEGDMAELEDIFLHIYANPVIAKTQE